MSKISDYVVMAIQARPASAKLSEFGVYGRSAIHSIDIVGEVNTTPTHAASEADIKRWLAFAGATNITITNRRAYPEVLITFDVGCGGGHVLAAFDRYAYCAFACGIFAEVHCRNTYTGDTTKTVVPSQGL